MPRVVRYNVKKLHYTPTFLDMKEFGLRFSKDEWAKLTSDRVFLEVFTENLHKAKKESIRILNSGQKEV